MGEKLAMRTPRDISASSMSDPVPLIVLAIWFLLWVTLS